MDWLAEFLLQLGISDPSGYGWVSVVITFVLAAGFTAFLIPRVLRFALQAGWADLPNERRLNARPLPNVGGFKWGPDRAAGNFVGWLDFSSDWLYRRPVRLATCVSSGGSDPSRLAALR